MKGKKIVLEQIDKLNSIYNMSDHDELLKLVEKLYVNYESVGPLNITSKCEKYNNSIIELINKNIHFTLTFTNNILYRCAEYIFKDYPNTTVINTSIYEYGFLKDKFDYIFSVPAFGIRDQVDNIIFIYGVRRCIFGLYY